ncbi:hypothetical protein [Enterococcus sp. N249-2]
MNHISENGWIAIISSLLTVVGTWLVKKLDLTGIIKKTEIENKDDVYNGWKDLYTEQKIEKEDLKREYKETRQQLELLQKDFLEFKMEMSSLKIAFKEKEEGYLIQIDKLEVEIEELKEENEILKDEVENLKGSVN